MEETYRHIWDPVSADLPIAEYHNDVEVLINPYKKNSNSQKQKFIISLLLSLCLAIIAVYFTSSLAAIAFGLLPLLLYAFHVIYMHNTLMLALLSLKKQWIYTPKLDEKRAEMLSALLPIAFGYGYDRHVADQIWGSLPYKNTTFPFWTGKFTYSTGSGKSKSTTTEQIFIFKLPKSLPVTLWLGREGFLKTGKHEIKTESKEFNDLFRISSPDEDDTFIRQEIIALLSPSVQTRLIDFAKAHKNAYTIGFHEDMLIISFNSAMWRAKYTNLFLKLEISKKDMERYEKDLEAMVQLPTEILTFLD